MSDKPEKKPPPKKCFIIGPIGTDRSDTRNKADFLKDEIVKRAFYEAERRYVTNRSDTSATPGLISVKFLNDIEEADIVVADLTGLNPNVFYELGFAHTSEKKVIHFAEVGTKLPFDTYDLRTIFFDTTSPQSLRAARMSFLEHVDEVEKSDYRVSNPITAARGHKRLVESSDPRDQVIANLVKDVRQLREAQEQALLRIAANEPLEFSGRERVRQAADYRRRLLAAGASESKADEIAVSFLSGMITDAEAFRVVDYYEEPKQHPRVTDYQQDRR